ncbi:MAG: hypothetical protein LBJ24_00030, partial [Treponema sp.]|nr:hypothetical protein [Treponema sp.]
MTAIFFMVLLALPAGLGAQNEPSGGDEPLKAGEAVILSGEAPPAERGSGERERYLRAAILPMSSPGAPVRIRFEKPLNTEVLRRNANRLNYSIHRNWGSSFAGSWEWKDSRELQFIPSRRPDLGDYISVSINGSVPLAENGEWIRVSAEKSFRVENFMMGTKTGSEPVVPGRPRFVAFLNSGTRRIGEGPLYLLYDQALDEAAYSMISVTAGRNPLEVNAARPQSLYFDPEGVYDTSHIIALSFPELPPDQASVLVRYPFVAAPGSDSFGENSFTVFTHFSFQSSGIDSLRQGRAARLESSWTLNFNSPVDPESFRSAFSISPLPSSLNLSFYGYSVEISAVFSPGRVYSMKLAESFTDILGNSLKESLTFAFKSQDLPPVFTLPGEALVLESGINRVPLKYRNLRDISVNILTFNNPGDYIRNLERTGSVAGAPKTSITAKPNPNAINNLYHADIGIDTGPGLKLLDIKAEGRGSESQGIYGGALLVQTTNIGVSAKVSDGAVFCWVTALNNGLAIQGAQVSLYNRRGEVIAGRAATDGNGTVLIKTSAAKPAQLEETLYVAAEYSGDAGICRLANSEMSSPWQFNLPGVVAGANPLAAALFTDRGAYRPGESVYFKTFVRDLPEYQGLSQVSLTVKDSRGREIYRNGKNLDAYRGAAWEIRLGNDAAVGEYTASLTLGSYIAYADFQVEEYRVPTFQVNVTSPDDVWLINTTALAECDAEYLRGGALTGKALSWRVYRQPEDFSLPAYPGYVFTLEQDPNSAGTVHDERGTLPSAGKASISFRPSFPNGSGPMRFIVQASVTDDDRQNYAARISRLVHGAELYAGIKPPDKKIFRAGEKLSFPFMVTDTAGNIRTGENVVLYIDTLSYNQNTLLDDEGRTSTYNREVLNSNRVTSASSTAAPQELSYTPARAGYYRLRLEVQDRNGRTNRTGFVFTVGGDDTVAWPRYDRERIEVVLDKQSYKPGDTAAVIVQTPFESARGLLTIEANGVLDAYLFSIDRNTPRITFPVRASYLPNAYVSVILLRGRAHYAKDATGFETGAPAYRAGYTRLEVDPESQRLALNLPQPSINASPGQKIEVLFTVRNAGGRPSDASAAVRVVDEAALGLTGCETPDPIGMA